MFAFITQTASTLRSEPGVYGVPRGETYTRVSTAPSLIQAGLMLDQEPENLKNFGSLWRRKLLANISSARGMRTLRSPVETGTFLVAYIELVQEFVS